MKALVVGYGSIGRRHARLLTELKCEVAAVSRREIDFFPHYWKLPHALVDWKPAYVVVAGRTSEHYETFETLTGHQFQGRVLIEKPLFSHPSPIPRHNFAFAAVAYNLRCHPLIKKLSSFLKRPTKLVTVNIHVGSYLPTWRPSRDYRRSYSADKEQGGGVLRDLSHELDYALWLFGPWERLTAWGGHLSKLEISSEDAYTILMQTPFCPLITVHMNYLNRTPRREIVVNTDENTIEIDLIQNTFAVDGETETVAVSRDDTYLAEHRAMISGEIKNLCTFEQAIEVLYTVEAAEKAAHAKRWMEK